jgi:hypothetical protein
MKSYRWVSLKGIADEHGSFCYLWLLEDLRLLKFREGMLRYVPDEGCEPITFQEFLGLRPEQVQYHLERFQLHEVEANWWLAGKGLSPLPALPKSQVRARVKNCKRKLKLSATTSMASSLELRPYTQR